MAQVTISINSREYAIACEDGQEARILQLSHILDEKAQLLTNGTSQISESMLLAMIALLLADELSELKKEKGKPEFSSQNESEKLEKIDVELACIIKSLNDRLKMLAKEINLL